MSYAKVFSPVWVAPVIVLLLIFFVPQIKALVQKLSTSLMRRLGNQQ
jgi:hypothetical protein